MKTVILLAIMITASNAFALSYEECVETVSSGIFENKAGEAFTEKLNAALTSGSTQEIDKAYTVIVDSAKLANSFCDVAADAPQAK